MSALDVASKFEIREIQESDYLDVIDLWALAFNVARADVRSEDFTYRQRIVDYCKDGISYLVGAFDGKTLAASVGVIMLDLHLGDQWIKCGAIAGVATYPEYRRQGLTSCLLADCLHHLDRKRVQIATLWPFSYDFYERLGWSATTLQYIASLRLSKLKHISQSKTSYRFASEPQLGQAMDLHEAWSERFNMSLRRSEFRWRKSLEDIRYRRRLYLHDEGYMLWSMEKSKDGCLEIDEWCYLTEKAFWDGLALISQMDSQFQTANVRLPEIEPIFRNCALDSVQSVMVKPGMMSRVVNLDAFLQSLRINNPPAVTLHDPLCITGENLPEGNVKQRGPGAFVQHVTGFWSIPNNCFPESLYEIAGGRPAYCVEQY